MTLFPKRQRCGKDKNRLMQNPGRTPHWPNASVNGQKSKEETQLRFDTLIS
jgi:hypothetical protein